MKKQTEQYRILTLTCLVFLVGFITPLEKCYAQPAELEMSVSEAEQLRFQYSDSSIRMLKFCYTSAQETADTLKTINALMALARVYGHQARYKESYDRLWAALLLADAAQLEQPKSAIYRAIGRYYSFYSRKENALKFLGLSLDIKRKLVEEGILDKARLVENYHALCATYREFNEPELCQTYLDSSFLYHAPSASIVHYSSLKLSRP